MAIVKTKTPKKVKFLSLDDPDLSKSLTRNLFREKSVAIKEFQEKLSFITA